MDKHQWRQNPHSNLTETHPIVISRERDPLYKHIITQPETHSTQTDRQILTHTHTHTDIDPPRHTIPIGSECTHLIDICGEQVSI